MESIGVTRHYKVLAGRYNALPFVKSQAFDLDRYVVDKALDGLFYVLAEEERKIRTDPAARVTDLLRTVFGISKNRNPNKSSLRRKSESSVSPR
jgi:hypothetical protein